MQPSPGDVHEDSLISTTLKRNRKKKRKIDKKSKFKSPEAERRSLKWPHLYDILRNKGYSKEKAARISNSRRGRRKKGRLSTQAGRAAAKARRMAKYDELIKSYLTEEEIEKVSTKAGPGYKKKRKARRKSIGVRSLRQRRAGKSRRLPRSKRTREIADLLASRGRHGRNY